MLPFWAGSFGQYLNLYRAMSAAVAERRIRLGGPVLAYVPGDGPALIERFLRFLADEPEGAMRLHLPASQGELEVRQDAIGTLLRWTPSVDPAFYSYEVTRDGAPIAPEPMQTALWVGTAVSGPARYAVRTVTASGMRSPWTA